MNYPNTPFCIPAIRSIIPEKLKPFVIILFLIIIQFSGGVYLASISEMIGTTALLQEDIMMAGYASLIGMALNFVYMFRIKCAIPPKNTFLICGTVIIIANLIAMHTTSVPLLVGVCFIAGFFRMQATFECNSTIQLWLTPKRDMSVFFCWVYLIVNSSINLSGIMTVYLSVLGEWHYMQWTIIGLMCLLLLIVILIYQNVSTMPPIPFLGIDWLGMIMWGSIALSILFICIYGEHYDWWNGTPIQIATIFGIIILGLTLWRSSFIRHPYIFLETLTKPIVWSSILVIIIADILLAPSHIFEHALMKNILHYNEQHLISLNWIGFMGTIVAVIFTWQFFAIRKWTYQRMLVIAFSCICIYLCYFYFFIDYNLPKKSLFFPIFIRNMGYVIMAITVLTSLTRLSFPHHFFQGVTLQNLFSASLGSAIGTAIVERLFKITITKNAMLLSSTIDGINNSHQQIQIPFLHGIVQQQALMISMKEIYGYLLSLSLISLLIILIRKSSFKPTNVIHPKFKTLRKQLKHELKMKLRFKIWKQGFDKFNTSK